MFLPLDPPAEPKRILVVRNRFIGDTMLAIPFLRNLRRRFPDAVIDVLVESGSVAMLAECPYTDEMMVWQRPPRVGRVVHGSIANVLASARWVRSRGYDRAYLLKRSLSSVLLVWCAGIPHRIGFVSQCLTPLLTRAVPLTRHRHQAQVFLDLLRADGIPVDNGHNENWVSPPAAAKAEALLAGAPAGRTRVFLAPCSTDVRRQWPLERMARVVEWLVRDRDCEIFLCGSPEDVPEHAKIRSLVATDVAPHIHDHSSALSVQEAGALLARMDLCVGVDTGLPHIAASFGVPVVVLAGPTDPNRWHPWCTHHEVVKANPTGLARLGRTMRSWLGATSAALPWPAEPVSMRSIAVERVIAAVAELLDRSVVTRAAAARPPLRTVDLRHGDYRYELYTSKPRAAAPPATKPLAHAH